MFITAQNDSIRVKVAEGYYINFQNKMVLAKSDTTILLPKTCKYSIFKNDTTGHKFYDSLSTKANRLGKIPGEIVDMFLVRQDSIQQLKNAYKSAEKFSDFTGYKIRKITFDRLHTFGQSVFDTISQKENKILDFLNNIHSNTRIKTLEKYITIKVGENVDPLKLSESERILRELYYLRNSRIILIPVDGSDNLVDVLIITQDLFPLEADGDFTNFSNWNLSLTDINIGGYGNSASATISAKSDRNPFLDIKKANYLAKNIAGSFVDFEIKYKRDDNGDFAASISGDRDFYTYSTKYAGGTNMTYVEKTDLSTDSSLTINKLKFLDYGAWAGRSFAQKKNKAKAFVFSALYEGVHYYKRPIVSQDSNKQFYMSNQILLSATYSYNKYYNARWVNRFGITEDIPYGFNATITFGPDKYEYYNRFYTGLKISQASEYRGFGYIYNDIGIGGFFHNDVFEQGVIDVNSIYFSNTHLILNSKTRQHVSLTYTLGLNRFYGETISITDMMGMEGVSSTDNIALSGTQRSGLEWIAMSYTPISIIGFDIATFVSTSIGTIGSNDHFFWENDFYSGFSFGIQTKNENLIFSTLMLRLSYFPVMPNDMAKFQISFKAVSLFTFKDFKASKPQKIAF